MSQPLRIALIGAGGIGMAHLRAIEAFETEGRARLVAVADPFVDVHARVKETLESRGVRWHLDFQKLLEQEIELDAVAIATPIPLHARMIAAALARSLFVYVEKPAVPLIQQLNDLTALDARHKVAVGFQQICSEPVRQLKRWKAAGALGAIRSIRVRGAWPRLTSYYERAAWAGRMLLNDEPVFDGPVTNAFAHPLQNIMYLAGDGMDDFAIPTEVEGEFYRARPIEGYDVVCLRGRLESGVLFSFAATHAVEQRLPHRLDLVGEKGRAWIADDGAVVGNDLGLASPEGAFRDPFDESYRRFIEFASGNASRAATRLHDTRGYVLATNGALIASNGIGTIAARFHRTYGEGAARGYDVPGLTELILRSAETGNLFSEQGAPWARKGRVVLVRSLRSLRLQDYISH